MRLIRSTVSVFSVGDCDGIGESRSMYGSVIHVSGRGVEKTFCHVYGQMETHVS